MKITVKAEIATTGDRVWELYTSPLHIVNWNFASPEWHCPSAENNLMVGGLYIGRMEAKDGSSGFDFKATYKHIDIGNEFTYITDDAREINVAFSQSVNSTVLTIVFDAETINPPDLQQQGWQSILDNFKKYAESYTGN